MKIYRYQEAKEQDCGAILGQPGIGIKAKNLVNDEILKGIYKHKVLIKEYILEQNTSLPLHPSEFIQVDIVLSGEAVFSNSHEKFELEEFDTAFKYAGESFSIKNSGNCRLKILSIILTD